MRKLAFLLGLAVAIFVSAQVASATQVIDDTLQVNSLKVGQQGAGGVTFFNGTIVNETTGENSADNPVTFGDNVRIDGRVYRGASAGADDNQPFLINDNVEIAGGLTVSDGLTAGSASIEENLAVEDTLTAGSASIGGSLTVDGLTAGSALVEGDLTVAGDLTADGSPMLKKKIYTGTFDFNDDGDFQMLYDEYTYYWKTVSVPEIGVSDMPIVQVFTGTPTEATEIYPDFENAFVNISFLVANFIVEDGKVHILFRFDNGTTSYPLYNSEEYKIVVMY